MRFADRQALHAYRLEFDHPTDGRRCAFEGELAPDMAELARFLGSFAA